MAHDSNDRFFFPIYPRPVPVVAPATAPATAPAAVPAPAPAPAPAAVSTNNVTQTAISTCKFLETMQEQNTNSSTYLIFGDKVFDCTSQ